MLRNRVKRVTETRLTSGERQDGDACQVSRQRKEGKTKMTSGGGHRSKWLSGRGWLIVPS